MVINMKMYNANDSGKVIPIFILSPKAGASNMYYDSADAGGIKAWIFLIVLFNVFVLRPQR